MSIDNRETLKLFREIGKKIVTSIKRNFDVGGRPDKWKDSRRGSKYIKGKKGKTLIDKGILRNSINYKIVGSTIKVGTNVVYGAFHHFGFDGTIDVLQHTRVIKKAFGKNVKSGEITITVPKDRATYQRKICMPARPFMMIQEEDKAIIMRMVAKYMKKIITIHKTNVK